MTCIPLVRERPIARSVPELTRGDRRRRIGIRKDRESHPRPMRRMRRVYFLPGDVVLADTTRRKAVLGLLEGAPTAARSHLVYGTHASLNGRAGRPFGLFQPARDAIELSGRRRRAVEVTDRHQTNAYGGRRAVPVSEERMT